MKKLSKITALLLAAALCVCALAGCSIGRSIAEYIGAYDSYPPGDSAPGVAPLPSAPRPSSHFFSNTDLTPFDEMVYERPDVAADTARLEEIVDEVKAAEDFGTIEGLLDEAGFLYSNYDTMTTLAYIHASMDRGDKYWVEEDRVLSEGSSSIVQPLQQVTRYLYESKWKTDVESLWGEDYFDGMPEVDSMNDVTKPLFEKNAALLSDYHELAATGTVTVDGLELTQDDIYAIEDLETYIKANRAWLDKYHPILGGIYVDLVKNRQQIARELGYDSYTDLAYDGTGYSSQMAEGLIDDIVEYVAPVYESQAEVGYRYYPDVSRDLPGFTSFLRDALHDLSPDMLENFDLMLDYGLCDLEPRTGKDPGAYTIYISDYTSPFICSSYTGDAWSMTTLAHEFGHFNEFCVNYSGSAVSLDLQETFSGGLELLVSDYYPSEFGAEDGYKFQYDSVSNIFSTLVNQPYFTAMELRIYAMDPDDVTVEAIDKIAAEEGKRFGLYSDEYGYGGEYHWIGVSHIYEAPFYTISYATSAVVALQIWEVSLTDMGEAMNLYETLLYGGEPDGFIAAVEAAGLQSPFDTDSIREIADIGEQYLVEEDWDADTPWLQSAA